LRHEQAAEPQPIQVVDDVENVEREGPHPASSCDTPLAHRRRHDDRAGKQVGEIREPLGFLEGAVTDDHAGGAGVEEALYLFRRPDPALYLDIDRAIANEVLDQPGVGAGI
jgi:hypothetical protein